MANINLFWSHDKWKPPVRVCGNPFHPRNRVFELKSWGETPIFMSALESRRAWVCIPTILISMFVPAASKLS